MAAIDKVLLIDTELTTSDVVIECELDISSGSRLPNYTGAYTVTPKVEEQKLPTKNKSMLDDVTVVAIPFEKTSNLSGGYTVNIAYPS